MGAGNRGRDVFGRYATEHPDRMRVVAFAEPDDERRGVFARAHRLTAPDVLRDWRELLDAPRRAAAAIVATADDLHTEPALAALRAGYHVLLEKPMALRPEECSTLVETAEAGRRILQIGHVLRYTPFYRAVHRLVVEERRLGEVQSVRMAEHVAHWHFAHSYVRGKWRTTSRAAPLILAKCCHDLDLMSWLVGRRCERVASFGSLEHYRPENAPEGAPSRCTDGCPVEASCLHSAPRFYARDRDSWPWSDVALEATASARLEALRAGPYGRCVYAADNDVVDRQSVILEFEGGVQGDFLVDGFSARPERTLRVQGTHGELVGQFESGELTLRRAGQREAENVSVDTSRGGHGGGDRGLLDHFTEVASRDAPDDVLASGRSALESHLIGFAAERARLESRVVPLAELR